MLARSILKGTPRRLDHGFRDDGALVHDAQILRHAAVRVGGISGGWDLIWHDHRYTQLKTEDPPSRRGRRATVRDLCALLRVSFPLSPYTGLYMVTPLGECQPGR